MIKKMKKRYTARNTESIIERNGRKATGAEREKPSESRLVLTYKTKNNGTHGAPEDASRRPEVVRAALGVGVVPLLLELHVLHLVTDH